MSGLRWQVASRLQSPAIHGTDIGGKGVLSDIRASSALSHSASRVIRVLWPPVSPALSESGRGIPFHSSDALPYRITATGGTVRHVKQKYAWRGIGSSVNPDSGSHPTLPPHRIQISTDSRPNRRRQINRPAPRLVGAARFELTTPCTQNRCATRLRHAPTCAS